MDYEQDGDLYDEVVGAVESGIWLLVWEFMSGIFIGLLGLVAIPLGGTIALALLAVLIYIILTTVAKLAVIVSSLVVGGGQALLALSSSVSEVPALVAAHLTIGVLVGALVGLRAPKPRSGL